jgi:hypothetical protein
MGQRLGHDGAPNGPAKRTLRVRAQGAESHMQFPTAGGPDDVRQAGRTGHAGALVGS